MDCPQLLKSPLENRKSIADDDDDGDKDVVSSLVEVEGGGAKKSMIKHSENENFSDNKLLKVPVVRYGRRQRQKARNEKSLDRQRVTSRIGTSPDSGVECEVRGKDQLTTRQISIKNLSQGY